MNEEHQKQKAWLLPLLFLLAGAVAGVVGLRSVSSGICPTCTGLLGAVLPWLGMTFYVALAGLAWRRPESPLLPHAMALFTFVHASLLTEALLLGHYCIGCLVIAGVALLAALVLMARVPAARLTMVLSLVLGATGGFLHPFDRLEDNLTRRFWPSKILSQAPAFVDRTELTACGHSAFVRLLVYEDERTCQSCSSVGKRLIPSLVVDFPGQVCIHKHTLKPSSGGQILPVLVLYSRAGRLVVIEGLPSYDDLKELTTTLLSDAASPQKPN